MNRNVGFFKYYTVQQLPNFLLASPILYFCFVGMWCMNPAGSIWILKCAFWTKPYLVLTCETIIFQHQYAALFDYCRADWLRFFSLGFLQSTANSCMFTVLQLAGQIYELPINIFWIYWLTLLTATAVGFYKQNPRILIYVYHWGLLFLIAVAFLHIQVYCAHDTH